MSMSTTRPTPKALRLYVQAVVCVGGLTLFQAVLDSARTPQPLAWLTLAVLAGQVPGKISRLAVSPDGKWLALVADEKAAPSN